MYSMYEKEGVMPFIIILRFADVGVEKRSKKGSMGSRGAREEDSFSISINDTWLSVADNGRVAIKDDQVASDLHTFWKGEGNVTSIREARGEYILW